MCLNISVCAVCASEGMFVYAVGVSVGVYECRCVCVRVCLCTRCV